MLLHSLKKNVGYAAARRIQNGMLVGLGSGSTVEYFLEALGQRVCDEDLQIKGLASSSRTTLLAKEANIPLLECQEIQRLDLTVDGADFILTSGESIKGGGGALLREKITASMAREMLFIVDKTKLLDRFSGQILPVEVLPFGKQATEHHIAQLGLHGTWRKKGRERTSLFLTDNGNYILDVLLPSSTHVDPAFHHAQLMTIPGVIETGFFHSLDGTILVAQEGGSIKEIGSKGANRGGKQPREAK